MAEFISTTGGKIINIDAIAFLTSRIRAARKEEAGSTQLVVGFSAASPAGGGNLMPLSLVLDSEEALDFLDQLADRGVDVEALRAKLS